VEKLGNFLIVQAVFFINSLFPKTLFQLKRISQEGKVVGISVFVAWGKAC